MHTTSSLPLCFHCKSILINDCSAQEFKANNALTKQNPTIVAFYDCSTCIQCYNVYIFVVERLFSTLNNKHSLTYYTFKAASSLHR